MDGFVSNAKSLQRGRVAVGPRRFRSPILLVLALVVVLSLPPTRASYMPEGGKRSYAEGERVPLYVNQLTSRKTLVPLGFYNGPFCQPPEGPVREIRENLGATLQGYRTETAPYSLEMKRDKYCEKVCLLNLDNDHSTKRFAKLIRQGYHTNWMVDRLPAASVMENEKYITTRYWQGIPIGVLDYEYRDNDHIPYSASNQNDGNGTIYLHNHLNIEIMYHKVPDQDGDAYTVVRVQIEPFSIHHELEQGTLVGGDEKGGIRIDNPIASCHPNQHRHGRQAARSHSTITSSSHVIHSSNNNMVSGRQHTSWDMVTAAGRTPQPLSGQVLFTYDVIWRENHEKDWSDRWDIYLNMDFAVPQSVHWMSLANSVIFCIILVAILVTSLVCCLRKERNMYKKLDMHDDDLELVDYDPAATVETPRAVPGWIAIRNDVFLPPTFHPTLLAVLCGTGAQLLATCAIVVVFAAVGYMSSVQPGRILRGALVTFATMGVVGGLVAGRLAQTFRLNTGWKRAAMLTALGFPGLVFGVFLIVNMIERSLGSTKSVSFMTTVILLVLWLGVSAPLVGLGAYLGHSKLNRIDFPFASSAPTTAKEGERRPLPPPRRWYARIFLVLVRFLLFDMLPFGCLFVELYYMLSCTWMGYYYSTYGFLFLALLVGIATSAFTAVVVTYFRFRREDYRWWWSSLTTAGAIGGYVFLYSFVYFRGLKTNSMAAAMIYFAYMTVVSLGLACMFGFVGVYASLVFSKRIYSSLRWNRPNLDTEPDEECDMSPSQEMTEMSNSTIGKEDATE